MAQGVGGHANQQASDGLHAPITWTFANAAARVSFTPATGLPALEAQLDAEDLEKWALDLDTGIFFRLTGVGPTAWTQVQMTAAPHSVLHENGGGDEISVTDLSGLLADPQTPAAHAHTHASTTGKTADDHHNQQHAIGGSDHTGELTNVLHGSREGSTLHAVATASVAGFLSAADKVKIDGLSGAVLPVGFIDGLHISNSSGTPDEIVDIAVGSALSSDGTRLITVGSPPGLDITVSGIGGLDTGTVDPNLWYAVYVVDDSADVESVGAVLSLSLTVGGISFPAGYDKARRVGMVRTDGASNILLFFMVLGEGRARWMYWKEEVVLQPGGTANGFTGTVILASTRVPPTAARQQVDIRAEKTGVGNLAARVEVVPDGWNEAAGGMFWTARAGFTTAPDPVIGNIVEMPVGPAQLLRYRSLPLGSAFAEIVVVGWEDVL